MKVENGSPCRNEPGPDTWTLGGCLSCIVVVLVLCGIGYAVFRGLTAPEDKFAVGDCLLLDDGEYEDKDCAEPSAGSRVYATKTEEDDCVEVPGTSTVYLDPIPAGATKWYCIGDKDADLAKAINDIQPGECAVVNGSAAAERSPCDTPGSRPVLQVLEDVGKFEVATNALSPGACEEAGATETKLSYGWGIESQRMNSLDRFWWDRLLCLGDTA